MATVELCTAFSWTCEDCGRDNFARAVVPESLAGLIPEGLEMEDFEGGQWVMAPDSVTCAHCSSVFATAEPGDDCP